MKSSLSLIGFMGSGKTVIGKKLSIYLNGFYFMDLDNYIEEKYKMSINDIFKEKGEEYFREIESLCLKEVFSLEKKIILSTGGGVILKEENRKILKENSTVIYLKGSFETLLEHLKDIKEINKRPLLKKRWNELYNIWKMRLPLYEETCDITIDIDNKSVDTIVKEVLTKVNYD
ncbi:MAG: shikimate kinase [Dictyoglomus sp. NZ13-RE01]|nr:MAG: shikimate kinase [Dictyoglomus sp. NZ13-RE01]